MKKSFKHYFIKSLWFILYAISVIIEMRLLMLSFDMLFYEFTNKFVFLDYSAVSALDFPCSYTWVGIFTYFLWKIFNSLSLYIFSYHIYWGSCNWYKFFRERKKLHDKQDRLDFKQICDEAKKNKKEKKNEKK